MPRQIRARKAACSKAFSAPKSLIALPFALAALLYGGGYLAQFIYNYGVWQEAGAVFGTAPQFPDGNFFVCVAAVFRWPSGLYGLGICVGLLALLIFMVMRMGYSDTGEYDRDRNLTYSNKGTYGTAGFMTRREMKGVLDLVPNIRKHHGTILGELDGQVVCIPEKTRFNGNLAVYGARLLGMVHSEGKPLCTARRCLHAGDPAAADLYIGKDRHIFGSFSQSGIAHVGLERLSRQISGNGASGA